MNTLKSPSMSIKLWIIRRYQSLLWPWLVIIKLAFWLVWFSLNIACSSFEGWSHWTGMEKESLHKFMWICCSITKSCSTLCGPMDCSTPGFPVLHYLLEFAQTHIHWLGDAIQPSHPVVPFSSNLQSFPASGSFPMSWLFASGGQTIGASASASIIPMNVQG